MSVSRPLSNNTSFSQVPIRPNPTKPHVAFELLLVEKLLLIPTEMLGDLETEYLTKLRDLDMTRTQMNVA